jgi:hypothetical protein
MKSEFYNFKLILLLLGILTFVVNCSSTNNDDGKVLEPSPEKRAREFAEKGGGIFGDINNRKSSSTTFEFASSNVLWRATLKSLDFLPLLNADYSGGVIVYDWYSQANNPKEQIKISVQFLNNELRSDSVKIIAHKKICETLERCSNSTLDQNFANSIKDSIITSARALKIEEAKKEKK